ncbi:hypothetical protein CR51_31165 [Caballeronia megalochromosomata]|nr:hypothetical protein CR51_31165 [Caballeronia megalochromosomata]
MNTKEKSARRLSLTQHFNAPDAWIGHFGWLCGYSADAPFMDDAIERFTGQSHARRAESGRISLAMMLDPGNPMLSVLDVPGLMHLPMRADVPRRFRLLHAKVALLGYRHPTDASQWLVRLIVSTGNWTRQTLEESLDLAFTVDVSSAAIAANADDLRQNCADIHAAWRLMQYLKPDFDCRLIASPGEAADADALLSGWIAACAKAAGGEPARFIDNRKNSLLAQLPRKVNRATDGGKCNRLAMGSGFFESAANGATPQALLKIIETLVESEQIMKGCKIDLFVNPHACQAVAQSTGELARRGVTVRRAPTPADVFGASSENPRTLHAKFLFAASRRDGSNDCRRAWLYLGSGNLTKPGFTSAASPGVGNLEAGVVFAAPGLYWSAKRGVPAARVVSNVLPIDPHAPVMDEAALSAGQDMPERPPAYLASPIAWMTACSVDDAQAGGSVELRPSEPMNSVPGLVVLDRNEQACVRSASGFAWQGERPRMVNVRWTESGDVRHALVPVLDEFGRVAATSLSALDIDEVWWQLANFPLAPDQDTPDPYGEGVDAAGVSGVNASAAAGRTYPIRQVMELVENVAQRQTCIDQADWNAWCNRLEQTLSRAASRPGVAAFAQLDLNPLAPLRARPFRPPFAETAVDEPGARYEAVLKRIEEAWGIESCGTLGSMV